MTKLLQDTVIGSEVQAYDADLQAIAGLTPSNGDVLYYNSGWQRLAKGTDDQVLTLASGIPSWADAGGGGGSTFWARLGSSQSITGSTHTKVQFDTEAFDTSSDYDNVTNYRFTPSAAGKYVLGTNIAFTPATSGTLKWVRIQKNGATIAEHYQKPAVAFEIGAQVLTTVADANGSTDYFEVTFYHDGSTANLNSATAYNYFYGYLIE